jgi:hypothetical protein
MRVAFVAFVVSLTIAPLSSAQTLVGLSCKPVFESADYSRGVPWTFVDEGLDSLPHVYPKHVLLAQRRVSQLGSVTFSLLVYKEDAAKPDVTIEGMVAFYDPANPRAWRFSAHCSAENLPDGLVTTLEEIAKLPGNR